MNDKWESKRLGDCFALVRARVSPNELEPETEYVGLEHIEPMNPRLGVVGRSGDVSSLVTPFRPGDTLFGRLRPYLRKVALADRYGVCTPEVLVLRPNASVLPGYLHLLASAESTIAQAVAASAGTRMPRTSSADLRRLTVEVPPVEVQRRIVDLMEVVDAHIRNLGSEHTALTATVRELRESFIAFMQGNADWVEFSSVTEDVRRPLAVEEQASYSQIGIRSHGRGVFGKEAVTGKTLGTKKMLTVRSGDLVFNIVFAWEGAVAVVPAEFDGWASSHRFPTFRRIDGGSEEFLRQFFLSGWGLNELLLASPGGAGRNRTLGRSALGRIRVPQVPRAQEVLFVEAITAVEALVEGVGHERDSLVAFRARLLQSLLDRGLEIAEAYDVLIDEGVSA